MPPHTASGFDVMPGAKLAKTTSPSIPPRGEEAATVIDRRPLWKSRKSSSRITPKEPSPTQQYAPSTEKARIKSKSGSSTPPLKEQHVSKGQPPLKSCLKKPSDGSQKSILSSPPLSHRSEFTQMSLRSDYTNEFDNSLSASLFQDQDTEGGEAIKNEPENDEEPVPLESSAGFNGRQEFPVSFVEAFSRNEEAVADSPHMGPYLLKLAKSYASGENPVKALEYCIRAVKFYEKHARRENALELVISLHILASLHCHLGQYEDAVALLERSLTIPDLENGGVNHALAAFSGRMQLGDTLNMVGKLTPSLQAYHQALEIQKSVLGEFDPRVSEICNYVAEAHVQALEFAEAEKLCEHSLAIHTEHSEPGTLEEAADRRLLAIIYSAQGEHGKALDALVYANDIFVNFGQEIDVATGNQSIGDELLALGRDAEALQCFGKCVEDYKTLRGEHNALVASAYTSLAELYLRTNKPREAKANCQNALHIYAKHGVGHIPGDIAYGLIDIASILEQLNEKGTALLLLQRAYNIQDRMPGQQATVAGIEAQLGILHYTLGQFKQALQSFQDAATKMRNGTLRNSALLGMVLNQMGLTSIELGDVHKALGFLEEAKSVMDHTAGPHHLDTLDVCNNLACTYTALGRVEEARDLLEEVVHLKEEKLGAVHPDVEEDRARLQELLNQVGQTTAAHKRSRKLVELLSTARKAFHTSK